MEVISESGLISLSLSPVYSFWFSLLRDDQSIKWIWTLISLKFISNTQFHTLPHKTCSLTPPPHCSEHLPLMLMMMSMTSCCLVIPDIVMALILLLFCLKWSIVSPTGRLLSKQGLVLLLHFQIRVHGSPNLWTRPWLQKKKKEQAEITASAQLVAATAKGFFMSESNCWWDADMFFFYADKNNSAFLKFWTRPDGVGWREITRHTAQCEGWSYLMMGAGGPGCEVLHWDRGAFSSGHYGAAHKRGTNKKK